MYILCVSFKPYSLLPCTTVNCDFSPKSILVVDHRITYYFLYFILIDTNRFFLSRPARRAFIGSEEAKTAAGWSLPT